MKKYAIFGVEVTRRQWKYYKKMLSHEYKRNHRAIDTIDESLLTCSRYGYDEDEWEYMTEFGYLSTRTDLTDEEISDLVEDMRMVINSPYDCTGKQFTCWISTHRNPSGLVSYIHRIGIDV